MSISKIRGKSAVTTIQQQQHQQQQHQHQRQHNQNQQHKLNKNTENKNKLLIKSFNVPPQTSTLLKIEPFVPNFTKTIATTTTSTAAAAATIASSSAVTATKLQRKPFNRSYSTLSSSSVYYKYILDQKNHQQHRHHHYRRLNNNNNNNNNINNINKRNSNIVNNRHKNGNFSERSYLLIRQRSKSSLSSSSTATNTNTTNSNSTTNNIIINNDCNTNRINRTTKEQERLPDRINYDRRGLTSIPIFENENNLRLLSLQHNLINIFHIPSLSSSSLLSSSLSSNHDNNIGIKQNNNNLIEMIEEENEIQKSVQKHQQQRQKQQQQHNHQHIDFNNMKILKPTSSSTSSLTSLLRNNLSNKKGLNQNYSTTITTTVTSTKISTLLPSSGTNNITSSITDNNYNLIKNINNNNSNSNNHISNSSCISNTSSTTINNNNSNNNFVGKSTTTYLHTTSANHNNNNYKYPLRRSKSFINGYSKHLNNIKHNFQKCSILKKSKNLTSFEDINYPHTNTTISNFTLSDNLLANSNTNNISNNIKLHNNSSINKNQDNNNYYQEQNNHDYLQVKNSQLNSCYGNVFQNLVFLDLYDNQIEKISNLDGLKNLTVLLLGKNRITDISGLISIKNTLRVLDLHGNKIINLNNKINCLKELKSLNLAGNQIRQINQNDFDGLINLKELNLKRNKIKRVYGFNHLINLERLWLCHNDLHKIEDMSSISKAINLQEVTIENNPVSLAGDCVSFLVSYLPNLMMLSQMPITEQVRKAAMMWRKNKEISDSIHLNLSSSDVFNNIRREEVISNARTNWELLRSQQIISINKDGNSRKQIINSSPRPIQTNAHNELITAPAAQQSSSYNETQSIIVTDQNHLNTNQNNNNNKIQIKKLNRADEIYTLPKNLNETQDDIFRLPPITQSYQNQNNSNPSSEKNNSSGSSLGPNIDSSSSCYSSDMDDKDNNITTTTANTINTTTITNATTTTNTNTNTTVTSNPNNTTTNTTTTNINQQITQSIQISKINEQLPFECENISDCNITEKNDFKKVIVIENTASEIFTDLSTINTENNNNNNNHTINVNTTILSLQENKDEQKFSKERTTNNLTKIPKITTEPITIAAASTNTINLNNDEFYNSQSDKTSNNSMITFKSESEISTSITKMTTASIKPTTTTELSNSSSIMNNSNINTSAATTATTTVESSSAPIIASTTVANPNTSVNPSFEKSVKNNRNNTGLNHTNNNNNNNINKRFMNNTTTFLRSQTAKPKLSSTANHHTIGISNSTNSNSNSSNNNNNSNNNNSNTNGNSNTSNSNNIGLTTTVPSKSNKQQIEREREQGGDYLIEICGRYLNIYGFGALRFIDKQWNIQKANDVHTLNFSYINFNSIATILCRIKLRFTNAESFVFRETNISTIGQLNALSELQGIKTLFIDPEGNYICIKNWRLYAIYRLSHWGLKTINGIDITDNEIELAHKEYLGLSELILWSMPDNMLQPLLTRLRLDETCLASKLSPKEWLMKSDQSLKIVVGKEALQWKKITTTTTHSHSHSITHHHDEHNLRDKGKLHFSIMIQNTCNAIEKLKKLETLWPNLLFDIVKNTLIDYSQLDVYLKNLMTEILK